MVVKISFTVKPKFNPKQALTPHDDSLSCKKILSEELYTVRRKYLIISEWPYFHVLRFLYRTIRFSVELSFSLLCR